MDRSFATQGPQMPGWRVAGNKGPVMGMNRIACRNPSCTMAAAGRAYIEYRGPESMHLTCKCCGWYFMGPPQQQAQQPQQQAPKKKKWRSFDSVPVVSGSSTPGGKAGGKASGSGRGTPKGPGKGKGAGHASPHPDSGLATEVRELKERLEQALKALADPSVPKEKVAPILAPPKPKPTVSAAKAKVAP